MVSGGIKNEKFLLRREIIREMLFKSFVFFAKKD